MQHTIGSIEEPSARDRLIFGGLLIILGGHLVIVAAVILASHLA